MRYLLGMLAYLVPTFPLGYFWHLRVFKAYYEALQVYRSDVIIPLGLLSMVIQGLAWAFLYARLFAGERRGRGALKFGLLAAAMAWSFLVLPIAAKHRMASVLGFVQIETAFIAVQYLLVSPLMALAMSSGKESDHAL
jgi:hypothetical protein